MSASIDKGPGESEEDSREVLSAWLDDYIAGRCDRAKMHESFLEVCRSNPEAPWDALALLDQYQRRGRVDVGLARSLKAEIAQLVFGVANQTEVPRDSEATLDTTGSRWRKLYSERGSLNADEATPEEDAALRRDFEPPLTRPPPMSRASASARTQPAGSKPAKAEVGVGTTLRNRYELMELVGGGRFGTLYQAFDRHRSHLPAPSCYVAVRVLQLPRDERDGREAALAEIEREAYEAQSLSHPNIVSVFDLDRHHDVYFVVMELLDGEPLSDVIDRLAGRPMSRERALAVIGAVGSALTYAHQRLIAHGDLKPAAIVLTTTGEVKVREFGFARSHRLDQWGGGEPSVDRPDANATAAYASAERVAGAEPHPRDDVYSLACIAYELLSGRHPYGGRSAPLARAHGRAPQKIPGLSVKQWNALQLALNWNREARRIDVGTLMAALGCADAPQYVPAVAAEPRLDNPFGRGKGVLLAFLLIAGAGAIAWWQLPGLIEPSRVSPVATPAEVDAERTAPSATTAPEEVVVPPAPSADANPTKNPLPEDELGTKAPTGAIVAATADPPPAAADTAAVNGARATTPEKDEASTPATSGGRDVRTDTTGAASRPPSVEFDKDTYVVTESDGMVKLTVRRNGSTRGTARFRWILRPNSAEAGSDYAAIGPSIEEIGPGSRTTTITIPIVSDVIAENTELFLVELQQVDGGPEIGEQAHAAVIVIDDD